MKIKKNYEKELEDKYWRGVQNGIRFALKFPQEANRYANDITELRNKVQGAELLMDKIVEFFKQLFSSKEDGNADSNKHSKRI